MRRRRVIEGGTQHRAVIHLDNGVTFITKVPTADTGSKPVWCREVVVWGPGHHQHVFATRVGFLGKVAVYKEDAEDAET